LLSRCRPRLGPHIVRHGPVGSGRFGLGANARSDFVAARSQWQLQLVSLEDDPAHGAVGQFGDPRRGISLSQMIRGPKDTVHDYERNVERR
jgi:hypothetical protein